MNLVSLRHVSLAYGEPPLLEAVDLEIAERERVCLVGRNGEGKTTLLRLLAGELEPDGGEVWRRPGLAVAALAQALPSGRGGAVRDVVLAGLGEAGALAARERALDRDGDAAELARVQARLNALEAWDVEARVARAAEEAELAPDTPVATLSGGQLRRLLIARALAAAPDVLVLDEPTNHLDLDGIEWLERRVEGFRGSVVFTTHDRALLRRLATRIVELDRGALTVWPGDYDNYLRRREERLAAELRESERRRRELAAEERWIRQGILARRTRNQGRVRRLLALREERRQRRSAPGQVRFAVEEAEASGRRVVEAEGVGFAFAGRVVVRDLSTVIQRGDRVGVIGPNGAGKTTLLRLLLGDLAPDTGRVRHGTKLEVAYFDQMRTDLDPAASVFDAVADGADAVRIGGRSRHVMGYLADFLFTSERARGPVGALSGGERNRLALARLFARPSNLLVLDEPTNDLDVETLELLEELLAGYAGTLLLVSHDREFLDNVVTGLLAFEGPGRVVEHAGGYSEWRRQRPAESWPATGRPGPARPEPDRAERAPVRPARAPREPRARLTYNEQRELAALPERIEALEARVAALQERLADPELYRRAAGEVAGATAALRAAEAELERSYARWSELEARAEPPA